MQDSSIFSFRRGAGNLEIVTSHFRLLLVNVMGRDDGEKGGLKDEYQRDVIIKCSIIRKEFHDHITSTIRTM